MLSAEERAKILAAVRSADALLADKLTEELSDRGHAVNVARAVAADETNARLLERAVAVGEQAVAASALRERRWELVLGPKGLIAAILVGLLGVATTAISAYFGQQTTQSVVETIAVP